MVRSYAPAVGHEILHQPSQTLDPGGHPLLDPKGTGAPHLPGQGSARGLMLAPVSTAEVSLSVCSPVHRFCAWCVQLLQGLLQLLLVSQKLSLSSLTCAIWYWLLLGGTCNNQHFFATLFISVLWWLRMLTTVGSVDIRRNTVLLRPPFRLMTLSLDCGISLGTSALLSACVWGVWGAMSKPLFRLT